MKEIFSYVKPYKVPATIALLLMLFELVVELSQPLIMAKIINDGIIANEPAAIMQWGAVLLVLALTAFLAGIINSYFSAHTAQSFGFDVRNALFQKIQAFSMATYHKFPTSVLITRLTSDIANIQQVLFMLLRVMARTPLAIIGSLVLAFMVNAKLAALLLIVAPIIAVFLFTIVIKGIKLFGKVQGSLDGVNRMLQENLQAIRLVKAYLRGQYEASRFEKVARRLKIDAVKAMRTMELIQPVVLLIMNMTLLVILWLGATYIANATMNIGDVVAVVNYTMRITMTFTMFVFITILFARAKASSERVAEILTLQEGIEVPHQTIDVATEASGTIRFEDVSFSYGHDTVLQNINFSLAAGEKLAIIGATGSGKSTLLQLLLRFYEPTAGTIRVNGIAVNDWSRTLLRQEIAYVPQRAMLFTGSIFYNMRWGNENASDEAIYHAAKQAQIATSIEGFENGYDTIIGQKGVNLSGGQKQRLSIARALLRKSPILVLDDSTSALDVKTEQALWRALEDEHATMLVVTQKITTAQGADKILLLDKGKQLAFGTPQELEQSSQMYRDIAASQQRGRTL